MCLLDTWSACNCFTKLAFSKWTGMVARSGRLKRPGGSTLTEPSEWTRPRRKTIDERCPSPVARRLIRNRTEPGGTLDWTMAGIIDGLNRAAESMAYSMVKQEAMNGFRT